MGTMTLPVPMTDAEIVGIGDAMSDALARLEAVRNEKKIAVSGFNRQIGGIEEELDELAKQQREKVKKADVEIVTEYDAVHREMIIRRCDTNEVVSRRPATLEERQPDLPLPEGAETAEAGPTEEQVLADTPEQAEEMRAERIEAEGAERKADSDEIQAVALATDAAPKALLKAPKKKLQVQDEAGNPLPPKDDEIPF